MRTIPLYLLLASLPAAGQDFSAGSPYWQRLLVDGLPASWSQGEGFDRSWQGEAVLLSATRLEVPRALYQLQQLEPSPAEDGPEGVIEDGPEPRREPLPVVLLCFEAEPAPLRLLLPAPTRLPEPGTRYTVSLHERQGWGGKARGLVLCDADGPLLLYEDGGYGPAFRNAAEREGLEVSWAETEPARGEVWDTPPVTFQRGEESIALREGARGALGGWHVELLVARIWRGKPPTDIDLSPMAYLVVRGE